MAVLDLVSDAPAEVPRYRLYGGSDELGQRFVLVGYGEPGHGATGQVNRGDALPTRRAGLNRYETVYGENPEVDFLAYDFDSGLESNNLLGHIGFESDLGYGADEVLSATGDSGAPSFIGGAVAGVTAFGNRVPSSDVNDLLDSSWGEAGFDTRVSQFRQFILNATDGTALFVPEPSGFAIAISALGAVLVLNVIGNEVI